MFGSHHLERVRRTFADQFAIEGAQLVYRKNLKGEPIPVSETKRDHFVRDFERATVRQLFIHLRTVLVLSPPQLRQDHSDWPSLFRYLYRPMEFHQ